VSQSVYVAFPLDPEAPLPAAFPAEHASAVQNASLAIWTTTPWTMPANAAVAVNDKLRYSFAKVTGVAANKAGVEAEVRRCGPAQCPGPVYEQTDRPTHTRKAVAY
jgi:isoleucyl-tRNA synthetase